MSAEQSDFNREKYTLEEILKPQKCVLLVIDMQNDFLHNEGFFAKRKFNQKTKKPEGVDISKMQETIPHIKGMIDAAHKAGVQVIFTKSYEDIQFRKGPDLHRAVKWHEYPNDGSTNSESGTFGSELHESMQPGDKDILVEKNTKWSAFNCKDKEGNSLQDILKSLGTETLVITGVVAEVCVDATIQGAYDRDYHVVVPENSVGSDEPEHLKDRLKFWAHGHVGGVAAEEKIKELWEKSK